MKLIDLSHHIHQEMPVYPGTEPPAFRTACTIEQDGFLEHRYAINSHTGTHIDAPAHILQGGITLDQMPVDSFAGRGVVADCTTARNAAIEQSDLIRYQAQLADADFLLLHTGWDKKWLSPDYYNGFPVLSPEAVSWLGRFRLKGIGSDTISVDSPDSAALTNHTIILGAGTLIIENLVHLDQLPATAFTFYCLPLPVKDADGAPTRAFAAI